MLRIFFTTDVHGSETCIRKLLSAPRVYNVNVIILLGDLSGKMINPIVRQPNGTFTSSFLGQTSVARNEKELSELQKAIGLTGSYYTIMTPEEMATLQAEGKTVDGRIDAQVRKIYLGAGKTEELFRTLVLERLKSWDKLIDEKFRGSDIRVFIAPGNDDIPEVDEVLNNFAYAVNSDNKKVTIDAHGENEMEMVTLSWANHTPWDTPRECDEEELAKKIEKLTDQIENMEKAIFDFHPPPYGTNLDVAAKLSKDLIPAPGQVANVGSTAVLDAIKQHQPLLGLHGHIHECRATQYIGRTLCINPGSEYSEGVLRGVIITLDKGRVKSFQFTSG